MQAELHHHLFYGENSFEKAQAVQKFLKITQTQNNFQRVVFSLADCLENPETFALLKEQFLTQNFQQQKYIFHLKNLDTLATLKKKFITKQKTELTLKELSQITNNIWVHLVIFLIKALQYKPKEHLLLLESDSDKLLWDNCLLSVLKTQAKTYSFGKEVRGQNLFYWITTQLQQNNLNHETKIVQTLLELCGANKARITQEITKLKLLEQPLTTANIHKMVEMSEIPVIVFLEGIMSKNKPFLQKNLAIFFQEQSIEKMQKLFALFCLEFRRILKIKWLASSGHPHKTTTYLKAPNWLINKSIQKAKLFTTKEVENILLFLQKNDLAIKYAGKNASVLLQQFCLQVVGGSFCSSVQ